jgi:hypothetical protein
MPDAPVNEEAAGRRGVPLPTTVGARLLSAPIVAYRRWVSPALPDRCRFYPSCSEYALTAISTHGPLRGLGLAIWRLLRCHPFHPGGIDHVPPPRSDRHRDGVTGAVT